MNGEKLENLSLLCTANGNMGFTLTKGTMFNSYLISQRTWKWTKKKLFFHHLALTALNSYIILSSCVNQVDHRKFRLVQSLFEMSSRVPHLRSTSKRIPKSQLDN